MPGTAAAVESKNSVGYLARQIRGNGHRESHFFSRDGDPYRQFVQGCGTGLYESRRGERLAVAADCSIRLIHRLFLTVGVLCFAMPPVTVAKLLMMISEHF